MNTLPDDAHELALDELADIDLVDLAEDRERRVQVGVELQAYVFALEGHYADSCAKNCVADTRKIGIRCAPPLSALICRHLRHRELPASARVGCCCAAPPQKPLRRCTNPCDMSVLLHMTPEQHTEGMIADRSAPAGSGSNGGADDEEETSSTFAASYSGRRGSVFADGLMERIQLQGRLAARL